MSKKFRTGVWKGYAPFIFTLILMGLLTLLVVGTVFLHHNSAEAMQAREARDAQIRQAVDRYMAGEDILARECPWLDISTGRPDRQEIERYFLNNLITKEERDTLMEYEVYWRKSEPGAEK